MEAPRLQRLAQGEEVFLPPVPAQGPQKGTVRRIADCGPVPEPGGGRCDYHAPTGLSRYQAPTGLSPYHGRSTSGCSCTNTTRYRNSKRCSRSGSSVTTPDGSHGQRGTDTVASLSGRRADARTDWGCTAPATMLVFRARPQD